MEERKSMEKIHGRETKLCHLPTELLQDIFCRIVSAKNIVQLSCVCKTWYGIVTNPTFISMHAHWCSKNHSGYLIYDHGSQISRLDKGFNFTEKLEFPSSMGEGFRLVGCCDGLLCMQEKTSREKHHFPKTYLWNPAIGALKKLPEITHHQYLTNHTSGRFASAFCFDRRNKDYKVFHIVREKLSRRRYVVMKRLYSLKTDSWKEIEGDHEEEDDHLPRILCASIYTCRTAFDGGFYWLTTSTTGWKFMMWFDFCDETIRKTNMPIDCDCDDAKILMSIGPLKNSLVLYVSDALKRPRGPRVGPCTIRTWVMKKRLADNETRVIWERQLSVVITSQLAWPLRPGLIDGEILVNYVCFLKKKSYLPFGVYDFQNKNIREIDTHFFADPNVYKTDLLVKGSFTYSESLFLLEGRATY